MEETKMEGDSDREERMVAKDIMKSGPISSLLPIKKLKKKKPVSSTKASAEVVKPPKKIKKSTEVRCAILVDLRAKRIE
jgi:hypothetical protein